MRNAVSFKVSRNTTTVQESGGGARESQKPMFMTSKRADHVEDGETSPWQKKEKKLLTTGMGVHGVGRGGWSRNYSTTPHFYHSTLGSIWGGGEGKPGGKAYWPGGTGTQWRTGSTILGP